MRVVQKRLDLSSTSIFARLNNTTAPAPGSSGFVFMFFSASVMGSQSVAAAAGRGRNKTSADTMSRKRAFRRIFQILRIGLNRTPFISDKRPRHPRRNLTESVPDRHASGSEGLLIGN